MSNTPITSVTGQTHLSPLSHLYTKYNM